MAHGTPANSVRRIWTAATFAGERKRPRRNSIVMGVIIHAAGEMWKWIRGGLTGCRKPSDAIGDSAGRGMNIRGMGMYGRNGKEANARI